VQRGPGFSSYVFYERGPSSVSRAWTFKTGSNPGPFRSAPSWQGVPHWISRGFANAHGRVATRMSCLCASICAPCEGICPRRGGRTRQSAHGCA
jgi:hypothetical protein